MIWYYRLSLMGLWTCVYLSPVGITNGQLAPCRSRWNCSITQCSNGQKPTMDPIIYSGTREEALRLLYTVLKHFSRVIFIVESDDYIHATFTSRVWGFVDDVEFYLPPEKNVIHMRSASRVGKHDLGVNKARLKKIKKLFYNLQSKNKE